MKPHQITIIGLGPAGGELLTREAWEVLASANKILLRTKRHPAVEGLPPGLLLESFDAFYEEASEFADVYQRIADAVLAQARDGEDVIYAVPGHPHVGEATVTAIQAEAASAAIPVRIVAGLSFVEPTLSALGMDGLEGLQLFDAITIAGYEHPPLNPDTPLLLGQLYNRMLANEVKLALMSIYPDEHEVSLVHAAGGKGEQVENVPLYAVDRSDRIDHLTTLFVPPLVVPSSLEALADAVAVLRSPDGCPWDREQTPQSLREGFVEEVAEVLEALDSDDSEALEEELGDLLLHLVMQVQMARENGQFSLANVIGGIYSKIRRRHPHVWGDWQVRNTAEVMAHWDIIKAEEKAMRSASSLDGIPVTLPALARAQKLQKRVKKVGFDWPDRSGVVKKVYEEIAELENAENAIDVEEEVGDVLFAVVNWARWLGLDAEAALRAANLRFSHRFRMMETTARARGLDLGMAEPELLDDLWEDAKHASRQETGGND